MPELFQKGGPIIRNKTVAHQIFEYVRAEVAYGIHNSESKPAMHSAIQLTGVCSNLLWQWEEV